VTEIAHVEDHAGPGLFFAQVEDYNALRNALRQRVDQLRMSRQTLDTISGLPSGYSAKVLSSGARKNLGALSLDLVLKSVGLQMAIVSDPDPIASPSAQQLQTVLRFAGLRMYMVGDHEALAQFRSRYEPRQESAVRLGNTARKSAGQRKPKPKSARAKSKPKAMRAAPYLSNMLPHHSSGRR